VVDGAVALPIEYEEARAFLREGPSRQRPTALRCGGRPTHCARRLRPLPG
jgi:hypothetical protein